MKGIEEEGYISEGKEEVMLPKWRKQKRKDSVMKTQNNYMEINRRRNKFQSSVGCMQYRNK